MHAVTMASVIMIFKIVFVLIDRGREHKCVYL